jgi:hypothetical protein
VIVRIGSTVPVSVSAGSPWQAHARVLSPQCGHRLRQAAGLSDSPAEAENSGVAVGGLDAVGLSWTSRDLIQNVRRADQAHSGATDATRTAGGFHAPGNGIPAGQRPFRWVGMGVL